MPNNPINITNVTPPRVPLTDARTGLISREWYRFFLNMFQLVGQGQNQISLLDVQYGPPGGTSNPSDTGNPSIAPDPLPTELISDYAELQKQVYGLEMGSQPQLGTMAQLQQAWLPWVTFDNAPEFTPPTVGTVAWDGGTTLGVQMTTGVLGRVNESEYVYVKASSAITKGQVCYHTGAVGASGVITAAPSPINLADPNQIVGVAAENIALNGFGLIQISGVLRGFNTTGSSVGETWADGDPLYYNPAYVGSFTKTKPSAPSQKTFMGEVINAGNGSSGSINVRIVPGSTLGGTDSNVQFGTLADKNIIQYDSALGYWKNVAPSSVVIGTATNLAGGAAGSVPYQSAADTTTFLGIGTAGQFLKVNAGATAPQWASPAALTKTDDTNVTLTLGGSASTALLNAASLTLGWTGQLGLSRGGTNANLTASAGSVVYSTASALAVNTAGSSGDWLKSGGTGAPVWTSPAALTKTDDTNVTLTLGGSASTALLNAASLTLGWTGQLSLSRGGTNANLTASAGSVVYSTASALAVNTAGSSGDWLKSGGTGAPTWTSPAALTKTDDTNVTLTLGGSASTALLNAASLTLGWSGQLAVSRGGTGLSSGTSGGIPYFSSSSALASSAALTQYGVVYGGGAGAAPAATAAGTTGQVLTATTGGAPSWASPAYTGTVTSVSVVSANGFAGTVATATTTPAITISTSITGLLYGNGTAIAATTVSAPLSYSAGTLSIPVATSSANGYLSSTDWTTFNNKQSTSAPVTYTANFSVAATDNWIINNKSGSSCTATLPAASSYSGRVLRFQNYQAQTLVSASSNVVQIGGGAATTSILLASAGDQCTLVSDGTNWIMMQYVPNNILLLE